MAGCSAGPKPISTSRVSTGVAEPPPREPVAPQGQVDATNRPLEVPPELAEAPKWIGRTYSSSAEIAPDPDRHVTYTLQRSAGRALLTVVTRRETLIGHRRQHDLPQVSVVTYLGSASEKAGVISIEVANAAGKLAGELYAACLRGATAVVAFS